MPTLVKCPKRQKIVAETARRLYKEAVEDVRRLKEALEERARKRKEGR